ncbi:MAG: hypothetical protein ABI977_11860 [Acidobacteriota bacterium]
MVYACSSLRSNFPEGTAMSHDILPPNLTGFDKNILSPDITATAKCHACNEVVLYERTECPYCGVKLDRQKMQASANESHAINQAVSSANTIRTFNPAAFLFLIIAMISAFMSNRPSRSMIRSDFTLTAMAAVALGVIVVWFVKHGRWPSAEPDYQDAKKEMRKSLAIWLGMNLVNLGLLIAARFWLR